MNTTRNWLRSISNEFVTGSAAEHTFPHQWPRSWVRFPYYAKCVTVNYVLVTFRSFGFISDPPEDVHAGLAQPCAGRGGIRRFSSKGERCRCPALMFQNNTNVSVYPFRVVCASFTTTACTIVYFSIANTVYIAKTNIQWQQCIFQCYQFGIKAYESHDNCWRKCSLTPTPKNKLYDRGMS